MRLAPIVPINNLDLDSGKFSPKVEGPPIHLLLSQVMRGDHSNRYRNHYRELRRQGHYLILDNGADEAEDNEGEALSQTLKLATTVGAQEVVLPDVQYDGRRTAEKTISALKWLRSTEGAEAYEKARRPRLMVVPQGKDEREWQSVAMGLIMKTQQVMHELNGPTIVVGVAKQYEEICEKGLMGCCEWLYRQLSTAEDIHLLGWAHRLAAPVEIATKLKWVRSIDSAKPIVYGMEGFGLGPMSEAPQYPGRPDEHYFGLKLGGGALPFVTENIERFTWAITND